MSNLRAILTVLGTVVALLVIAIPSHVDAARPARRRQRAGRIDQLPGVPDHRGGVRRGRERPAAGHRDGIRPDQRRRPARHPGRGRPGSSPTSTTWPPSRRSRSPTTTRSSPSRSCPEEGPNSESTEQLVQDIRALPPVGGDLTLGVAGQAASNIDISQALSDALPIYLAGRRRPVVPHHDPGVPLAPGAAHRDRRLRALAVRDLRPDRRRVPVGLGRLAHRAAAAPGRS